MNAKTAKRLRRIAKEEYGSHWTAYNVMPRRKMIAGQVYQVAQVILDPNCGKGLYRRLKRATKMARGFRS